jgi:hypothetical protein
MLCRQLAAQIDQVQEAVAVGAVLVRDVVRVAGGDPARAEGDALAVRRSSMRQDDSAALDRGE